MEALVPLLDTLPPTAITKPLGRLDSSSSTYPSNYNWGDHLAQYPTSCSRVQVTATWCSMIKPIHQWAEWTGLDEDDLHTGPPAQNSGGPHFIIY